MAFAARRFDQALGELDLGLGQFRMLAFLAEGDWAASKLADRLAVSRPSVTAMVDGLVARGAVERRPGTEDRRRVLHVITDRGRALLAEADRALGAELAAMVEGADDPDACLEGLARFAAGTRATFDAHHAQLTGGRS